MLTIKKHLIAFLLLFLAIQFCSCKKIEAAKPNVETKADSIDVETADKSTAPTADTTVATDSNQAPADKKQVLKMEMLKSTMPNSIKNDTKSPKYEGNIVSYCPEKMIEETPNIVSVTITKKQVEAAIKDMENHIHTIDEAHVSAENEIRTQPLLISKKMSAKLFYEKEDFDLLTEPANTEQEFDGTNDMNWDWIVVPKKVKDLQLIFKITAYDSINSKWVESGTPIILKTSVRIDPRSYFSHLWVFFNDKPEWLLSQILFPVVGYYVGRRKRKINGNESE